MSEQVPLNDELVKARVPGALKKRILEVFDDYGVSEATLIRDGVVAILEYIQRNKGYRRPVRMVFDEEASQQKIQLVAETQGKYEAKSKLKAAK